MFKLIIIIFVAYPCPPNEKKKSSFFKNLLRPNALEIIIGRPYNNEGIHGQHCPPS